MAREPRPVSQRRRFLIGLAVAALVAAGFAAVLLSGARAAESRARAEREAVVTLSALAEVVERAYGPAEDGAAQEEGGFGLGEEIGEVTGEGTGEEEGGFGIGEELAALEDGTDEAAAEEDEGERVRRAVRAFAEAHPGINAIRVVNFSGSLLEASTAPEDAGERAAPRRLSPALNEKPLFDLGQSLRSAVVSNRQGAEGGARGQEISIRRGPKGALSLAAPVERDGEVLGMVQMETRTERAATGFGWLSFLAAWLAPVALLFLLSLALGERRWLLAAVAAVLLVGMLAAFGRYATQTLAADRRATGEAVAARIQEEAAQAGSVLAGAGLPTENLES
ncbi:hypothetical protein EHM82_06330, partial [bacterium]